MSEIYNKFKSVRGQRVALVIERPVKTKKGFSGAIVKRTVTSAVRAGVAYDNVAEVQAKRESGELPAENAGLPWGQWEEFPHTIFHKGKRYFRFQKLNGGKTRVKFFYKGKEVDSEFVKSVAYASEFAEKEQSLCWTIGEENVKRINGIG